MHLTDFETGRRFPCELVGGGQYQPRVVFEAAKLIGTKRLAQEMGISDTNLYNWRSGITKVPLAAMRKMQAICEREKNKGVH